MGDYEEGEVYDDRSRGDSKPRPSESRSHDDRRSDRHAERGDYDYYDYYDYEYAHKAYGAHNSAHSYHDDRTEREYVEKDSRSRKKPKRSHSHSRSRSRSRSRDRRRREERSSSSGSPDTRRKDERRRRDDSPSSCSNRSEDSRRSDRDRDRERRELFRNPTNTAMLRNIPVHIEEPELRSAIMNDATGLIDIRLIRRKETGESRGFAFVEFQSVDDAEKWLDKNQGSFVLNGEHILPMSFSAPRDSDRSTALARASNLNQDFKADWICPQCGTHNFRRRENCFKCNISRDGCNKLTHKALKTREAEGFEEVGSNPCNTLLFRGLDALTTDETLKLSLLNIVSSLETENAYVAQDYINSISRGYAFVQFKTVKDAQRILDKLTGLKDPLEIDGKQVLVSYSKNTFNTAVQRFVKEYQNVSQGMQYQSSSMLQSDAANTAAAVAQAALQNAQRNRKSALDNLMPGGSESGEGSAAAANAYDMTRVAPGDVSQYQYDAASGYYYDSASGLYYDPNSQYYYNPQSGQFLYWDHTQQTYISVSGEQQSGQTQQPAAPLTEKDKKDKEKREKSKQAKKIAKDMEKWAQSMNKQKDTGKKPVQTGPMAQGMSEESKTADAAFAAVTKVATEETAALNLSDEASNDSTDSQGEKSLVDVNKMACLLCKRQFASKELLQKHVQMSDLHKENMEKYRADRQAVFATHAEYRDRAKERRDKYGQKCEAPPSRFPKHAKRAATHETPAHVTQGIGSESIGNRLLKQMGWSEGEGLGKRGQGRVNIIETKMRQDKVGLGNANCNVDPNASYNERVRQAAIARFNQLY